MGAPRTGRPEAVERSRNGLGVRSASLWAGCGNFGQTVGGFLCNQLRGMAPWVSPPSGAPNGDGRRLGC